MCLMLCLTLSPFFPSFRPDSMFDVDSRVSNRVKMSKKIKKITSSSDSMVHAMEAKFCSDLNKKI